MKSKSDLLLNRWEIAKQQSARGQWYTMRVSLSIKSIKSKLHLHLEPR